MHQTTIRFGRELWEKLEVAAERGGVSAAQYVREATIERLARSGALTNSGENLGSRAAETARASELARGEARALEAQSRLTDSRARKPREAAGGSDA
jgi:hypothetical protein